MIFYQESTINLFLINTFLFFRYGIRMLYFFFLLSQTVQISKKFYDSQIVHHIVNHPGFNLFILYDNNNSLIHLIITEAK